MHLGFLQTHITEHAKIVTEVDLKSLTILAKLLDK